MSLQLECLAYGVGHAQEGLCLQLRIGPYQVLLDCGIRDLSPLLGDLHHGAPQIDCVISSHAHGDHARGLLALRQAYPHLPIYASEVTAQLLPLNWLHLGEIPEICQALPWRTAVEIAPHLWLELFPAGHLPGASLVRLTYDGGDRPYCAVYTGDFLLSNSRLADGLPLEEVRNWHPDVLIVEGSYGTARYPRRRTQENELAERINRALADNHLILMPVPRLGLGQELLMLLRSHHHFTGRNIDLWVDASLAAGCDRYLELLPHLPTAVQNFARHQPLFWDDRIRPRMRRLNPDTHLGDVPTILLTDIESDWQRFCANDNRSWLILYPLHPGHPGPDDGLDDAPQIHLDTYLLSSHCDRSGTSQLIHNLRPQHIIFVHGSPNYLADLANLEELCNRYQIHCPAAGKLVQLPLRDKRPPTELPDSRYQGEVSEDGKRVIFHLDKALSQDSRWHNFADTGLVETRWQGDELVLRGISQRELLGRERALQIPPSLPCCANCAYYRAQQCFNPDSPLYGFKVTADGTCSVFEPL
ncbi:MBL fold metallo-hydrolase [Phormidium yuhuli AB48]|uniref:MBL fold metallo-hydrolase n=1 Tax=Phormidium yuhuli AB48 TaxID=2940671 RepID=A0ABY5ASQ0_9CYAN|nr:MBL fold metallo-hydrolase [Phormidium yuhuli]USR92045.1 MBL fold metallo-hydrolase [Phormidium yuhuli AB48]